MDVLSRQRNEIILGFKVGTPSVPRYARYLFPSLDDQHRDAKVAISWYRYHLVD